MWSQRKAFSSGKQLLIEWGVLAGLPTLTVLALCSWAMRDVWGALAVMAGSESPFGTRCPPAAVILMIWGYLLVPAAIGALASFALQRRLEAQEKAVARAHKRIRELEDRLRSLTQIDDQS